MSQATLGLSAMPACGSVPAGPFHKGQQASGGASCSGLASPLCSPQLRLSLWKWLCWQRGQMCDFTASPPAMHKV